MLLTSCVSVPLPPSEYMQDCKVSFLTANPATNGDVVRLAEDRRHDIEACNLDKAALRAWKQGYLDACGWRCKEAKN